MKKYLTLFIPFLLFSATCKKSDAPVTLPEATQNGANTYGANINGIAWRQQSTTATLNVFNHNFEKGYLFLQGNGQNKSIKLYIGPITQTGKYDLKVDNDPNKAAEYQNDASGGLFKTNDSYGGTVTITKLDLTKKIISGTFSFDAESVERKGDVVNITDGRFDVTYY